jgi:hypothetical protein
MNVVNIVPVRDKEQKGLDLTPVLSDQNYKLAFVAKLPRQLVGDRIGGVRTLLVKLDQCFHRM